MATAGATNFTYLSCTTLSAGTIKGSVEDVSMYNAVLTGTATSVKIKNSSWISGTTIRATLLSGTSVKIGATTLTASQGAILGGITIAAASINTLAKSASGGLTLLRASVTANGTASAKDGVTTVTRSTAGVYAVVFTTQSVAPMIIPQTVTTGKFAEASAITTTHATVKTYTYATASGVPTLTDVAFQLLGIAG